MGEDLTPYFIPEQKAVFWIRFRHDLTRESITADCELVGGLVIAKYENYVGIGCDIHQAAYDLVLQLEKSRIAV